MIHKWQLADNFSIEQTVRNANYVRKYKVNNRDSSLSTRDATEEKNTEYELLFNKGFENITYNGGLEFSNPEYRAIEFQEGFNKKTFGVFNQITWNTSPSLNIVSGLRFDTYGTQQ